MEPLQEIIEGCKRNDRKSQRDLYYQFYPALFNLCKKFLAEDHDIQTALNNGMMKVYKNISQFDSSKGTFFNWTYTIVRNSCLTILRDRKPDSTLEFKDNLIEETLSDPFESSEWTDIFISLDKLPPVTRAVCCLFYLEDFSIKEIEHELGIKSGTVKWHLNESRKRLKDVLIKNKKS